MCSNVGKYWNLKYIIDLAYRGACPPGHNIFAKKIRFSDMIFMRRFGSKGQLFPQERAL